MNIFLLDDPQNQSRYARFTHLGTWTEGSVCKTCGVSAQRLTIPLKIEWDPGTENIGDFSWCGYTSVIRKEVKHFLKDNAYHCRFGEVKVMPPEGKTRMPRVPYPYVGPELYWLRPPKGVTLDKARSGVELESNCKVCGQIRYTFKRKGLVISERTWQGKKIFCIKELEPSGATFVTQQALDEMTQAGFTNLCPKIAGIIAD